MTNESEVDQVARLRREASRRDHTLTLSTAQSSDALDYGLYVLTDDYGRVVLETRDLAEVEAWLDNEPPQ